MSVTDVINVKVSVKGERQLKRRLKIVAAKIKNPRVANRNVAVWLVRWVDTNFKTQGSKVGGWPRFKAGGRRIKGGGFDATARLLQDTGRLRASFDPFFTRTSAGIGTSLSYAKAHEFGLPSRNLPMRRMLPLHTDKSVVTGITKIYDAYIRKAIR